MFTVQIITSNIEFSVILTEWEEFLSHGVEKCSFWQDPNEIYSLVNGGDWDSMKIVLLRQDEKIVCVAPCVIRRQFFNFQFGALRIHGPKLRVLKILDSDFVYSKGVDKSACIKKLLEVLKEIKTEFEVIYLENIVESNPVLMFFYEHDSYAKVIFQRTTLEMQVNRRQILASSYKDWLLTLKRKTRYNLKRSVRLLFEKFHKQIEFKRVTAGKDVECFLKLVDEVFPKTWQAKTFVVRKRNTSEDMARLTRIAEKGWFRSYTLTIKDKPVAFILGYQYSDVFEYAECGYDPEYSNLGVGSVLNILMIKDLYEWGKPKILDFGFGENEYKRILGNNERNAYSAYLLFPGLWRGVVTCQFYFSIIGSRIKQSGERLGIDKYLRKIVKRKM